MFRPKIGFVFSGASARIAQECALTEALLEGLAPSGRKIRPDVVAGTSSGALNAVALNAVLRSKEQGGGPSFTWKDYREILFNLTNDKVFKSALRGVRKMITSNIPEGFVLDTSPLRDWFEQITARMGFDTLGSLLVPTYISVVNHRTGETLRLCSRNPRHAELSLVDILMASTAIPVVFPPVKIKGLAGEFIDGGTGRDNIPVEALLNERCTELYIISRMRGDETMTGVSAFKAKRPRVPKILLSTLLALEYLIDALFWAELDIAGGIVKRAFLYLPTLSKQYPLLDFSTQREQYEETLAWAKRNDPVQLKKARKRFWRYLFP